MKKTNVPNGVMMAYHDDLIIVSEKPILQQFMHQSKIRQFYKHNGIRIDSIVERHNAILKDHFVFDGDDLKLSEDGTRIFQEGKTEEDYNAAVDLLMKEETVLTL